MAQQESEAHDPDGREQRQHEDGDAGGHEVVLAVGRREARREGRCHGVHGGEYPQGAPLESRLGEPQVGIGQLRVEPAREDERFLRSAAVALAETREPFGGERQGERLETPHVPLCP